MAAILILEDRAVDRTFLATLLKPAGHAVNEESDGAEGLLAELSRPDLVISGVISAKPRIAVTMRQFLHNLIGNAIKFFRL